MKTRSLLGVLLLLAVMALGTGCGNPDKKNPADLAPDVSWPTAGPTATSTPTTVPTVGPGTPVPTVVPTTPPTVVPTTVPTVVPTPVPTAVPTAVAKTKYLKIKGTIGVVSTFNVQVWTVVGGVTTYLYNGPVTLDSVGGYEWISLQGGPYSTGSFFFSLTAPSNQGLTDEVHVITSGVDSIDATGYPGPSGVDGGSFGY